MTGVILQLAMAADLPSVVLRKWTPSSREGLARAGLRPGSFRPHPGCLAALLRERWSASPLGHRPARRVTSVPSSVLICAVALHPHRDPALPSRVWGPAGREVSQSASGLRSGLGTKRGDSRARVLARLGVLAKHVRFGPELGGEGPQVRRAPAAECPGDGEPHWTLPGPQRPPARGLRAGLRLCLGPLNSFQRLTDRDGSPTPSVFCLH